MVSFIVPVFYKDQDSFIYKRAIELINKFSYHSKIEVIIADSSKNPILQTVASNIKIIHTYVGDKVFSPSKARNQAVKIATKKYIFFYDVDMDYSGEFEDLLFSEIDNILETNKSKFIAIPFLYLTQKGTVIFESNKDLALFKNSFLKGQNDLVESISPNSSAMVMNREYFMEIGEFENIFSGHGGEDFYLIHCLCAHNPHSVKNDDYYTDFKTPFIANAKGFRLYMAYYSLPNFFKNLILVHRWHPRPLSNNFYSQRLRNENLLQEKMKAYDKKFTGLIWQSTTPMPDIEEFIETLMKNYGYDTERYPGFFHYANGVKPIKRPLANKIRKLIIRPREFFADIKFIGRLVQ
ncbi:MULTISPECIES: glycosyltransferase [Campylobacter]|uniref:glycosyltransferase n=1 Tax=Campylobacter TaxID=194 RepID=UPI0015D9257B|nr:MULTISPECIES: glycosyltransferase [unclassified Campylobacter]